jgi:hypothetical protein
MKAVFGPHGAVDEVGERDASRVGAVHGANGDRDAEPIGGAVDQIQMRHIDLHRDGAVLSFDLAPVEAEVSGVRKAWRVGVAGGVLVHARHQTP